MYVKYALCITLHTNIFWKLTREHKRELFTFEMRANETIF